MANKLPLNKVLGAMDRKHKGFFDTLSDEEKKAFSPFLMNRYASSVKGESALQEWWLIATNKRVNTNFFDLTKHGSYCLTNVIVNAMLALSLIAMACATH